MHHSGTSMIVGILNEAGGDWGASKILTSIIILTFNQLKYTKLCLDSSSRIGIVGPRSNYAGGEQGGIKRNGIIYKASSFGEAIFIFTAVI